MGGGKSRKEGSRSIFSPELHLRLGPTQMYKYILIFLRAHLSGRWECVGLGEGGWEGKGGDRWERKGQGRLQGQGRGRGQGEGTGKEKKGDRTAGGDGVEVDGRKARRRGKWKGKRKGKEERGWEGGRERGLVPTSISVLLARHAAARARIYG